MSKTRVYEVARELGLDNRELLAKIASLGIQVRNHMSALDTADAERVKRAFEKEKAQNVVEERIRPTVVRRRQVAKPKPVAATNGSGLDAHKDVVPQRVNVEKTASPAPAQSPAKTVPAVASPAPAPALVEPGPPAAAPPPAAPAAPPAQVPAAARAPAAQEDAAPPQPA
ncbi:MAG: translation initiation factor IF-2 N-terminal domain-containing protein, partial [Proteobacteria bacterium]|nr:translation initiation factor IF-2 N-terminal domain-containing protein [Pseudomonadota bacterium]